jgi:hypothetical protein
LALCRFVFFAGAVDAKRFHRLVILQGLFFEGNGDGGSGES